MHNGELAKKYQVSPLIRKECPAKVGVMYLDGNVAALWVWLNSSKSDDLRTNAFSTSTKCKSHGKNYLFYLLAVMVVTLQEVRINVYFILISESSPYALSYRSIYS